MYLSSFPRRSMRMIAIIVLSLLNILVGRNQNLVRRLLKRFWEEVVVEKRRDGMFQ